MTPEIDLWFRQEILPRERALNRFLRKHVDRTCDVADLRQEIYVRLYGLVKVDEALPQSPSAVLWTITRNLLIDRSRQAKVVPLEVTIDQDAEWSETDWLTPERYVSGREQLRRFEEGLKNLPERCRQVVRLRKVEGLSQRECAAVLSMSESTVERHIIEGMRALTDYMRGGDGKVVHRKRRGLKVFGR